MRDYGTISPKFWTGKTGKAIRGNLEAQLIAVYLMTGPHAESLGIFSCPIVYMSHDTGLPIEGASKGLRSLIEAGFCQYDEETEEVFVVNMAAHQIAETLSAADKRCSWVKKELKKVASSQLVSAFNAIYSVAYNLGESGSEEGQNTSPIEAPSKPLRSLELELELDKSAKALSSSAKLPTCPVERVVEVYHEVLPELPAVRLKTESRTRAIRKFWQWVLTSKKADSTRRAESSEQALAWLADYFGRVRDNDFLMGKTPKTGDHAGWKCDLDYLLTERGMKQVIEKTGAP